MTTNHINQIDAAVKSRIAVAIEYPDLDLEARERIWTRFLKMSGVEIDDLNGISREDLRKLAEIKLNGRLGNLPFQLLTVDKSKTL